MSDDGYDSMDAERDRAWRKANPELASRGEADEEYDQQSSEDPANDVEVLMSAEDIPIGLICNGKRYRVVPDEG